MQKLLFIFGTRPEAIKMAPIILACRKHPEQLQVKVCLTGQHREMLDQVMRFFEISGDYDLELMQPNQTLYDITARCLTLIQVPLREWQPDLVLVQGDTTSAFAGALAAFYGKVSIAHVEAGLRSHNKYSPFPEEINRKLISAMTDLHLTPTLLATENLRQEKVSGTIRQVGNTVIDALLYGVEKVRQTAGRPAGIPALPSGSRMILVTGHRRESFGRPFEEICDALLELTRTYPDVCIVYPVHLNPNIRDVVHARLGNVAAIHQNLRKNPRDPASLERVKQIVNDKDYANYFKPAQTEKLRGFQARLFKPIHEKVQRFKVPRLKEIVQGYLSALQTEITPLTVDSTLPIPTETLSDTQIKRSIAQQPAVVPFLHPCQH